MEKNYLSLSRSSDLSSLKERILYKSFEVLPGFLSIGTLLAAFILSWLAPLVAAIFIIIFDFFWLLRISYLSCHQIVSYREMKKNIKINWTERLDQLPKEKYSISTSNWRDIFHLIILPVYKENIEIIKSTLQSLKETSYPKEKMIIVLTVEERAGEKAKKTAEKVKKEFNKNFLKVLVTVHPKKISGEITGKGANVFWAINKTKEKILNISKIPQENIIVSIFDIDTKPFPQYFTCLTWCYLTSKKPLKSSYQPIPLYNNNVWQAPSFSRVIATSGTFWQMMQQERREQLVTYSSHSIPFKVLNEVGYPKNMVSDDSRIFWKSFLYYDGNYRVIPLHYPVSMDAVLAKSLTKTIVNQYKQQRRWAWGCENIPYIIFGFIKNKKISLKEKIYHTLIILEGFWSWAVVALLIFFLGWLPLIMGDEAFRTTLLSYNLPRFTGYLMTAAMIGMVVSAIVSLLVLPPPPPKINGWKRIFMVLQWFLLPVTLIVFGSFPCLDAQVRLILGKYLGFWATEKNRK